MDLDLDKAMLKTKHIIVALAMKLEVSSQLIPSHWDLSSPTTRALYLLNGLFAFLFYTKKSLKSE